MKIGILTHFYKNVNYGGMLQAYALAKKLNDLGFDAEQISYIATLVNLDESQKKQQQNKHKKLYVTRLIRFLKKTTKKILFCFKKDTLKKNREIRKKVFNEWAKKHVAHSDIIYTRKDITNCLHKYGCFIAGSDQIWNYNWYEPTYFLDFVNVGKKKIAYAASMGHATINIDQKEIFREHLHSFSAISVREKDMVDLLQSVCDKPIEWVVDPVFLLEKEDWAKIASRRIVNEKYVFCYYLSNDSKQRELARKYADSNKFKIVIIENITSLPCVDKFADIKLRGIDPSAFISLIKNAEYVFTDSFHAVAFSFIFKKQFVVFERDDSKEMRTRIQSVLELFEFDNSHFCDCEEKKEISYILQLEDMDYNGPFSKFTKMKETSKNYLIKNIKE